MKLEGLAENGDEEVVFPNLIHTLLQYLTSIPASRDAPYNETNL